MNTLEKKKEYLRSYGKAVRRMERQKEKIKEMRLGQIIPASNSDGMPHAHNPSDLSGYAAMLDEEECIYKEERYKCMLLCKEITEKIENLEKEDEKDLLLYRYIRRMSWEDIRVKMKLCEQHIFRIHKNALNNLKI